MFRDEIPTIRRCTSTVKLVICSNLYLMGSAKLNSFPVAALSPSLKQTHVIFYLSVILFPLPMVTFGVVLLCHNIRLNIGLGFSISN